MKQQDYNITTSISLWSKANVSKATKKQKKKS